MTIKFLSTDCSNAENTPIELDFSDNNENKKYEESYSSFVNQVLNAENLIVLAGSGTSLTFQGKAPSMSDLWKECRKLDTKTFDGIKNFTRYDEEAGTWIDDQDQTQINEDIELFLSRCDSFITLNSLSKTRISKLKKSIKKYKQKIIELADFADSINDNEWSHHDKFIRRLCKTTQSVFITLFGWFF